MKKTKWYLATALAMSFTMFAAACNSGETPNTPPPDNGSSGDTYQDYQPDKQPGGGQFDYDGNYSNPELTIDGKGDDEQWRTAPTIATYGRNDAVNVKVYRGEEALFFLFDVQDKVLLTQGVTNDDAVTHGDSIELYLDTKADGGTHPQSDDFQINLGIHGKTRIMQGSGSNWGTWNGLIDYEVDLKGGTLNNGAAEDDTGYTVEVMVRYRDIMIEKDDTIGIAFGQVDKWQQNDAPAGSEDGPWNWYGWTYNGVYVEPQNIDNYILIDKNNNLMSRDEQPRPDVTVAGSVKDTNGNPVANATVKINVDGSDRTATTDDAGYFAFPDVPSNYSYDVIVSKNGYLTASANYTRAELRAANGGIVMKDFELASEALLSYTTITGTVKNVVYGAVEATVSVKGTTLAATANADGSFTIGNVPANNGNVTLVFTAEGYAETDMVLSEDALLDGGTTALGDVNLNLPYADTGYTFGVLTGYANNRARITRTLTGIEVLFDGEHEFAGNIEFFLDTKDSTDNRDTDTTLWRFDLFAEGDRIGGALTAGGDFKTTGLEWKVLSNGSSGYSARFFIPYEYLNIRPLEVFGISFGQKNAIGAWDGWGYNGFIDPALPKAYVRVGATNNLYKAENNNTTAKFSGNVGMANITVTANGVSTTSNGSGDWSMNVPVTSAAVEVTYSGLGYVPKTTNIAAGYFENHLSWSENVTLEEQKVTITGTVTDEKNTPLKGVDVQVTWGTNGNKSVKTGDNGVYTIEGITTFEDVTIIFSLDGYSVGNASFTAADLAKKDSHTVDKQLIAESNIEKITLSGTVTDINGNLAGATVAVNGSEQSVTTAADGTFAIENFSAVDSTLTITKDGYQALTLAFDTAKWTTGDYEFETPVYLTKDHVALGGAFGTLSDQFSAFTPYVTRGETAFEFKFVGERAFGAGHIEMFVDTGLSAGDGGRNATDYQFNLASDGGISVDNWGGPQTGNVETLLLKVEGADSASPVVTFTLPYAYLGVQRTEIIGVSFGQWSVAADSWNGWDVPEMPGSNGEAFVKPEMPWDYIRIGVDNTPFWNAENKTIEELDLTGYNLHFGKAIDSIHGKVSRDGAGIAFEFVTLGDFGQSENPNSHLVQDELILIYFDKGETTDAIWNSVDYQIKIAPDGSVYGGAQAWYAADDGHKLTTTATITKDQGVTKITYTVRYSDLGISENDVFGFTLVEGWRTGDNWSNEYAGCLFTYAGGSYVVADAAITTTYIRMKADGTLVVADSNANVQ